MTWTARPTTPAKHRTRAHLALAALTMVAMALATTLPTGTSAARARVAGTTVSNALADAALPETGEIRPAPLSRSPLDRHAEVPPASAQALPPVVAEAEAQADMRVAEDRVVEVPPAPAEPAPEVAEAPAVETPPAPPAFPEGPSRLFARHDAMHLFTPSADPVKIGFHEAAYGSAVGMIPLGRAVGNDNGGKYQLPPLTPTDQQYVVLSSRGRPHHATSAVDIVMRPGEPVRSVVTGMVVEVRPYMLYGVHPDAMIRIRSAEDNSKIVTMLHVTGAKVHVGQQVLAGETIVAASATSFPFLSQIDYYLGAEPHPHVHVEVKRG